MRIPIERMWVMRQPGRCHAVLGPGSSAIPALGSQVTLWIGPDASFEMTVSGIETLSPVGKVAAVLQPANADQLAAIAKVLSAAPDAQALLTTDSHHAFGRERA